MLFMQLHQDEMKGFACEKGTRSFCEHSFCKKQSAFQVKTGMRSGHDIIALHFFLLCF